MYLVKKRFKDKETKNIYNTGDPYGNENPERIAFLVDQGFLEEKQSMEFPKHTGGGWFELSNGEKVKGKDEAAAAEADLGE